MMQHLPFYDLIGQTQSWVYLKSLNITLRGCAWQTPPLGNAW